MKKLAYLALATAASFALSSAAHASTHFFEITGPSGVFGDSRVSGMFERTFEFDRVSGFQIASLTITSVAVSAATALDFSSVTFNGVEFDVNSSGVVDFRSLLRQPLQDMNTITVRGMAGANASYSGTIALAAIPEPATWAMMIGGFGMVGFVARRRTKVTVAYA